MKIDTYLFGSVEVNPESVITFPNGLVAFENNKRFLLVHEEVSGEAASFTLQSIDEPELAFQIVDPTALGFHYELALSDAENALLQSPVPDDVAVMLMLFKQEQDGSQTISPNLRAPIMINTRARVGLQKIMENLRPNITLSNLVSAV
jgi:flagellar assembly factor FliW